MIALAPYLTAAALGTIIAATARAYWTLHRDRQHAKVRAEFRNALLDHLEEHGQDVGHLR